MADYVEDGQSWDEIVALATEVEAAGATIINTGIGWHEARVPTIVTSVPNSAFVDISSALAEHVDIPVVASNRINMPEAAEQILAETQVQLISMARPLLADPDWVAKAPADRGRRDQHLHRLQSGLPGPRLRAQDACPAWSIRGPGTRPSWCSARRGDAAVAVVGAGPAGLAAAVTRRAAGPPRRRCSRPDDVIGGQFDMARRIPGKEEFSRDHPLLHDACWTSTASTCGWAPA